MSGPDDLGGERVGAALSGLRRSADHVPVPPYAVIERRRRGRQRRQALGGGIGALAVLGLVLGLVLPNLGTGSSGTAVASAPQATVTVTVPPDGSFGPVALTDVSFGDNRHGVAIGSRCTSGGTCHLVAARSDDGGGSYGREVTISDSSRATKVAAIGANVVIAYAPGLFVSSDGGASWSSVGYGPGVVRDVTVAADGTLTVLVARSSGPAHLLRGAVGEGLTDAGAVPGTDATARLQRLGTDRYLVVTSGDGARLVGGSPVLGWATSALPEGCAYPSLSVGSAQVWWVACNAPRGASASAVAWRTVDAGAHWSRTAPAPVGVGPVTLTAFDGSVAYLSGTPAGLLSTQDGGSSWEAVPEFGGVRTGEPHLRYGNGSWVVAGNAVWREGPAGWSPAPVA